MSSPEIDPAAAELAGMLRSVCPSVVQVGGARERVLRAAQTIEDFGRRLAEADRARSLADRCAGRAVNRAEKERTRAMKEETLRSECEEKAESALNTAAREAVAYRLTIEQLRNRLDSAATTLDVASEGFDGETFDVMRIEAESIWEALASPTPDALGSVLLLQTVKELRESLALHEKYAAYIDHMHVEDRVGLLDFDEWSEANAPKDPEPCPLCTNGEAICSACSGTGNQHPERHDSARCGSCGGTGFVLCVCCEDGEAVQIEVDRELDADGAKEEAQSDRDRDNRLTWEPRP